METIRDFIEWFSSETLSAFATIFPYLLFGLVGLYLLWILIGYLRVSQVGLDARPQPVVPLPPAPDPAALPRPRGVPYCPFDGLMYPLGGTFCAACERDLLLDCVNDGATVAASEAFCYRCGTPTGAVETSSEG